MSTLTLTALSDVLTVDQVAELMQFNHATTAERRRAVYELVRSGRLQPIVPPNGRYSNRLRFSAARVRSLINH